MHLEIRVNCSLLGVHTIFLKYFKFIVLRVYKIPYWVVRFLFNLILLKILFSPLTSFISLYVKRLFWHDNLLQISSDNPELCSPPQFTLHTLTFMFIVWSISRSRVCLSLGLTNCTHSIKFSRGINANHDVDDVHDDDATLTLNYTHLSGLAQKLLAIYSDREGERKSDKCHSPKWGGLSDCDRLTIAAKLQVPQNAPIIAMQ